jgi:glycosyltransferase involved in cell wall biosynthesis
MKLSIITINYNHVEGLRRTIESVLAQTSNDYEFVVIDGGSTDGSVDVIKEYADKIDYWVSEPDGGIYPAMNKGVRTAHGEYCIFMNSGDEFFKKDVIESVVNLQINEDIVCGDICFGEKNISPNPDKVTMRTFYKHTLYHQASFIKTQLLRDHPYDETMRSAADWKFFMHELVFRNASYRHIPIVIARFEDGGVSMTNSALSYNEVWNELKACFPERVLTDYEDYVFGNTPYRKMFTIVENIPPFKRLIYRVDVFLLKLLNLKLKSDWIKKLKFSNE